MPTAPLITVGSCLRDIICYTKDGYVIATKKLLCDEVLGFEIGGKITAELVLQSCGGGAANAAVTFARLGLTTSIMASLGTDALGEQCVKDLMSEHVTVRYIQRSRQQATGTPVVINQLGSHKHFIIAYRGASEDLLLSMNTLIKANPRAIYLSALSGEHASSNMRTIISFVQKKGVSLFWNPGRQQLQQAGLLRRYAKTATVLLLNKDEALEVTKQDAPRRSLPTARLCTILHAFGHRISIITDGHRGAYAYDGKKIYYQRAIIGTIVNKTGAGDAFGSAFSAGLFLFKGDIRRSLRLAAHNAHSVVGARGAQKGILHKRDIRTLKI